MSQVVQLPRRVVGLSRINNHTPAARGKVQGPVDRRRRDELGEKLEGIRRRSIEAKRQTGIESGPFALKDWMR